jgi:hypothetical protein
MMDIKAAIRTGVQALIGLFVSVPLFNDLGVATELENLLVALGIGVVTLILRALEGRFPWLVQVLSLGVTKEGPTYE